MSVVPARQPARQPYRELSGQTVTSTGAAVWDPAKWEEPPATAAERDAIRSVLPQIDDGVVDAWLLYYYREPSLDWPPPVDALGYPTGRWRLLLRHQPLSYWESLTWRFETAVASEVQLSLETQLRLDGMLSAYVHGVANEIALTVSDGADRFECIVDSLKDGSKIEVPLVALERVDGLDLADGNHRAAAVLHCSRSHALDSLHLPLWIGRPPPDA